MYASHIFSKNLEKYVLCYVFCLVNLDRYSHWNIVSTSLGTLGAIIYCLWVGSMDCWNYFPSITSPVKNCEQGSYPVEYKFGYHSLKEHHQANSVFLSVDFSQIYKMSSAVVSITRFSRRNLISKLCISRLTVMDKAIFVFVIWFIQYVF